MALTKQKASVAFGRDNKTTAKLSRKWQIIPLSCSRKVRRIALLLSVRRRVAALALLLKQVYRTDDARALAKRCSSINHRNGPSGQQPTSSAPVMLQVYRTDDARALAKRCSSINHRNGPSGQQLTSSAPVMLLLLPVGSSATVDGEDKARSRGC